MKPSIKRNLLLMLIRDRTRITALLTAFLLALAGMVATKWLGFELTPEHNATIVAVVTLALGYAFEILTTEVNAKGIEKIQEASGVEVDRYVGPVTVAAVTGGGHPGGKNPEGHQGPKGDS